MRVSLGNARKLIVGAAVVFGFIGCEFVNKSAVDESPPSEAAGLRRGVCRSSADCPASQQCTTEEGVCNPPPGCQGAKVCPAVCYGTCEPKPVGGRCNSDSDCRVFADTCTGCDCLSLSICETDPVCPGPGVQCFVDPCAGKQAFCDAGHCNLRPAPASRASSPAARARFSRCSARGCRIPRSRTGSTSAARRWSTTSAASWPSLAYAAVPKPRRTRRA